MRASERQRMSDRTRPAWPGNAMTCSWRRAVWRVEPADGHRQGTARDRRGSDGRAGRPHPGGGRVRPGGVRRRRPASRSAQLGRPFVPDRFPGGGPVGGLLSALHAAADAERTVVCRLRPSRSHGRSRAAAWSAPNPSVNDVRVADSGRLEPMLATWRRRALPRVEAQFAAGGPPFMTSSRHSTRSGRRSIRPPSAM